MIKVKRSPARVSWFVTYGDKVISVERTKREATKVAEELNKKYGGLFL